MDQGGFVVLDVETTSGDPTAGRVLEVAVVDGGGQHDAWCTLVRPRTEIPPFIARLTGIRQHMLHDAPLFHEVAPTLIERCRDRILVAHNVRYDMTALGHEFARCGLVFELPTLCTEKLARHYFTGLQHYNLGSLCRFFGIPYAARHRALPDAVATHALLARMADVHGLDRLLRHVVPARPAAMRA
ncbi:MAG: 3'-5' exonuclease [Flavobacteriales bacterium]|nr:3'-5' exonuclease [Flavobacteriales bacterium]